MPKDLIVYLDIDGTILYESDGDDHEVISLDGQRVCDGIGELLHFVCEHCEPYWLSYRARLGRRDILETRIYPHLPPIAEQVGIAYWDNFKHEGIDPDRHFLWFDDYLEEEDAQWLVDNGLRDHLVMVDSKCRDNPKQMLALLKQRIGMFS